ncbi:MAG: hypothetical protein IID41_10185 [Planctomycetes bacterium]|nr:hypothetical protein [Planctomycetota bacterium]
MADELSSLFYAADGTLRMVAGAEDAPAAAPEAKPADAAPEAKPEDTPAGDTPEAKVETPEAKAPEATPEGDAPKAKGDDKPDEKPAPSAFDALTESLTDPDEIEAVRDRLLAKLPEDRRQPKVADTSAADAMVAQQRRGEEKRQNEGKRSGALETINSHLRDRKVHFLSDDAKPTDDYDLKLLNGAIDDLVAAEISLADNQTREMWSGAIQSRLTAHGGSIPDAEFKQMISNVAQQKVPDGMIGAFLDTLFQRGYTEGLAEGEGKAKSKDEGWRRSESAAVRATQMKGKEMEPESKGPAASSGDDQGRLDRLSGFSFDSNGKPIQATDQDRVWLKTKE